MRKATKKQKIYYGILLSILVIFLGGFFFLKSSTYEASNQAIEASQSSRETKSYYYFPAKDKSRTNVIFYQGALVEADSYSIWAKKVAEAGYNVYLMKQPLNLAVLGENKAAEVIKKDPDATNILAGHSLGGVMASRFAREHKQVAGMIFLASYPDEKGSLADTSLPVLSLTASEDGVLDWDNYKQAKKYLPASTSFETITGGNHAGFGSYGKQKGDDPATIKNQEQQEQVAELMIAWLREHF